MSEHTHTWAHTPLCLQWPALESHAALVDVCLQAKGGNAAAAPELELMGVVSTQGAPAHAPAHALGAQPSPAAALVPVPGSVTPPLLAPQQVCGFVAASKGGAPAALAGQPALIPQCSHSSPCGQAAALLRRSARRGAPPAVGGAGRREEEGGGG